MRQIIFLGCEPHLVVWKLVRGKTTNCSIYNYKKKQYNMLVLVSFPLYPVSVLS